MTRPREPALALLGPPSFCADFLEIYSFRQY